MKRKQFNQLRQLIKEEIKLAIKEQEAIKITPEQKKEFLRLVKRTMGELYLNTGKEAVNGGEVDRLLVSVLTNDETDWLEDIDQYGYDPDAVKKYGRLYTLFSILHYKETNTVKIQLLKKKLENIKDDKA